MRKLTLIFIVGMASSCNNSETTAKGAVKDATVTATSTTPLNYPYTIEHPDNWEVPLTR